MAKVTAGAQLYTVREYTNTIEDVRETLEKIADIGYKSIQISGFGDVDMAEVAKICEDNGLKVGATHIGWNRFMEDLDGVVEEHKVLDCEHPAIGGLGNEYRSVEGIKKFVDELRPIAEKLADAGMDFSYHNHNHELAKYDGKTWLARLYDEAPAEILKAEIDTYWIQAGGGDPIQWLRRCAGREPVIHFKDMIVTKEREVRFAEIGEGNLNWDGIIEASEEGGVLYAMVEQDNCYGRDPFESLEISYRNLMEMGLE
ncbi:MAG: sugar phosphate isomerase/epimerase family protein [Candidatus Brocadiia bacterium]